MIWYQLLSLAALAVCLLSLLYHIVRLIRLGNPEDYANPAGSTKAGIKYSFTGAMSPKKKESAFMHLPTYSAGLLYHGGTFLAILIFFLSFFVKDYPNWLRYLAIGILALSSISGFGILIKRASKSIMRKLSNTDDYLSNILVDGFHIVTILYLSFGSLNDFIYYIAASALLLYIPLGKLKHLVYFFGARYHLGLFYGIRGTWPPKQGLGREA